MVDSTAQRLGQHLSRFTGVDRVEWANGSLTLSFEPGLDGEIAKLVWLRVAERFKLEETNDGWAVDDQQSRDCLRVISYASADYLSSQEYVPSRDARREVLRSNLFSQLSRIYTAIETRIERSAGLPFNAWANALRVLTAQPIEQSELIRRTVLAHRAVRVVLRDLAALGWIAVEGGGKRQRIRLSEEGAQARRRIERATRTVASSLQEALGNAIAAKLSNGLSACIQFMAYEVPWGLTSYGPGDGSPTGGRHVAAQWSPHFVPAHGAEWPIVRRRAGEPPTEQPLPTLFAKTLARFMIDYEHLNVGSVVPAYAAQAFPDDGLPLAEARQRFNVSGTGRSGRERHFYVVTPIGRAKDRRAYLTPKGQTERDALGWALDRVETAWRSDIGDTMFNVLQDALTGALGHLSQQEGMQPWAHPTHWFGQLHGLAVAVS
jgi:DNA-binding MarR family transcriptional regulator